MYMYNNNKCVSLGVGRWVWWKWVHFKQDGAICWRFRFTVTPATIIIIICLRASKKKRKRNKNKQRSFFFKERKKQDIREELKMAICVEREREPTRECISRRPTVCLCVRVHIQEISFSPIYCICITYIYLKTRRRRKKQQPQTK